MLQTCLENKVIFEFLNYYDKNCWKRLIPSLLEIAILNLKYSFNKLLFSEEDFHNIIKDLKLKLKKGININGKPKSRRVKKYNIIFSKPPNDWRTSDGWGEPDNFSNYRHYRSLKKNNDNSKKKLAQTVKSKIKEQVDLDKKKYYDNINYINNKLSQSYNERERINYAISYDKDFRPEIIERTTIKKNKDKKGGKKIIQKMTQEEYEERYIDENQDNNEINYEENEDDVFEKSQGKNQINNQYNNNNNINKINNKIKKKNKNEINKINIKRNNLYHYKINYNNKDNNNNIKINDKSNFNNNINNNYFNYQNNDIDKIANSQKGFEHQFFKNQNRLNNNNIIINKEKNNNINIENNSADLINNNKNNNFFPKNINKPINQINKIELGINDIGKNVDLIGIEKKYKTKIDELEKNILSQNNYMNDSDENKNIYDNTNKYNNDLNKNNIDNYADKLKVNITNMEDYKIKKGIANIDNNNNYNNENNQNLEINIINNDNNKNNNNNNNNDINNEDDNDNNNENEEENNEEEGEEIEEDEKIEENEKIEEDEKINEGENNLYNNEEEELLSQMSNLTEKGKSLFKRAMDEYPPLEEDNF